MTITDAVGLVGVAAYVGAYALLQLGRLESSDGRYLLLNGIGAVLLLFSLVYDFNLPAFLTQSFWLVFTIVGYVRARRAA